MEIITDIEKLNAIGRCKEVDLEKGLKEAREIISDPDYQRSLKRA